MIFENSPADSSGGGSRNSPGTSSGGLLASFAVPDTDSGTLDGVLKRNNPTQFGQLLFSRTLFLPSSRFSCLPVQSISKERL